MTSWPIHSLGEAIGIHIIIHIEIPRHVDLRLIYRATRAMFKDTKGPLGR